jgi:hypothetical protein
MRPLANTKIVRAIRTGSWRRRPTRGRRHTFHYEHVLGTSLELQVVAELDGAAHRAEAQALAEWTGSSRF